MCLKVCYIQRILRLINNYSTVLGILLGIYTSALGAKMFVRVGGNSTEQIMFHLSYKHH